MHRVYKHIKILAAILLLALVFLLAPKLSKLTVPDILSYASRSPLSAALILIELYCLKSVLVVIPLAVLYVSAGALFPTMWAVLLTLLCLSCEITLNYLYGRGLGGTRLRQLLQKHESTIKLLNYHDKNSGVTCFLLRALPVPLPLDLAGMLLGASKMPFGKYLLFSLMGVSPGMIPWVMAGGAIGNPLSKEFLIPFAVSLLVAVAAFIIFRRIEKRKPHDESVNKV